MLQGVIEAVSNREDWYDQVEVRDDDGELVDLTGATIVFAVREKGSNTVKLLARTADATITIPSTGVFQFTFSSTQMRGLVASRAYEVGCTVTHNGVLKQLFTATVPVIDGIVP
jgi:hypothetical protein